MAEYFKPVYSDELLHYQVKGAKWGVRRWQYPDGSLTPEGRIHYGIGPARDSDPDLVDPVGKAKADIERVNSAYDNWKHASDNIKRYAKESNARRKLFEKRSDYDERIKTAKMRLDLAENAEIIYGNKYDDARKEAQARFEKYMQLTDELSSDFDWIDMHMYLETGEAGSKQTYIDRDEMERQWSVLEEALDTYWYSGLMNHDRASNANDEYRDDYEMNDSPRGKEAALDVTASRALRSATAPKDQTKLRMDISSKMSGPDGLERVKELSTIDISEVAELYDKFFWENKDDTYAEKAEAIAKKIAKRIVPDKDNVSGVDRDAPKKTTQDVIADYIVEKAMYAAAGDDEQLMETLWMGTSYMSGASVRDAHKQYKPKHSATS